MFGRPGDVSPFADVAAVVEYDDEHGYFVVDGSPDRGRHVEHVAVTVEGDAEGALLLRGECGADGFREAGAERGGASCLLVFPPNTMVMGGQLRPEMALVHFKTIAEASDLPIVCFQYPMGSGLGSSPGSNPNR